ncbi:hypothetical protein BH23ACT5_BH23ACT5_14380 [soil metagenome]
MTTFQGSLQTVAKDEPPILVSVQLDNARIRLWSDRHRIGSWDAEDVRIERESIFRFILSIDDEAYAFTPDDPSGFALTMNIEVDLTTTERSRFGLAERLRQVAEAG